MTPHCTITMMTAPSHHGSNENGTTPSHTAKSTTTLCHTITMMMTPPLPQQQQK